MPGMTPSTVLIHQVFNLETHSFLLGEIELAHFGFALH